MSPPCITVSVLLQPGTFPLDCFESFPIVPETGLEVGYFGLKRSDDCLHLRRSILYALDHRQEALDYAMRFARGLKPHLADRFVGMYVNHHTVDYGADGKKAIRLFLDKGFDAGLLPRRVEPEFVTES